MTRIAISMLSADFLHLARDVEFVDRYADIFHMDIMDGSFVPNISYGFPVVDAVAKVAEKPLDVHLMIVHPERYVKRFAESGASMLSFHLDAAENPGEVIDLIHRCGVKAGLAINPDIPVEKLYPYLDRCDFVLIMSVFAGFGGQKFIDSSVGRIAVLKEEIDRRNLQCLIEVDGGVSAANAPALVSAGAEILVSGSAVLKSEDPAAMIASMRV